MNVFTNISRHLSSNWAKYATKGVGLVTLGLVARDAHSIGMLQSDMYATERDASAAAYYLNNTLYNSSMSQVTQGVKDAAFDMELNQNWRRFFNSGIGYVKGFTSMLTDHVVPFALGLGALLAKGMTAKACAGGTILYGAYKFVTHFFGLGVPRGPLE